MKRLPSALILSTAIVAASVLPALAGDPKPLDTAKTHVDELPVDVSIGIIRTPGDVAGSIDVTVGGPGGDHATHVELPPLHGGDHAGGAAADHVPSGTPGAPADLPAAPDKLPDAAVDHVPADVPAGPPADVPAGPPADVPAGPPADIPAGPPTDVPAGPPADVPASLPMLPDVAPMDVPPAATPHVPPAGPLAH